MKSFLIVAIGLFAWTLFPYAHVLGKNTKSFTETPVKPIVRGIVPGGFQTPRLIGKNAIPSEIVKYLKGTGFVMSMTRYEASQSAHENAIISQSPPPLAIVKAPTAIQVIISTGKNEKCADVLNLNDELRAKYMTQYSYSCDKLLKSEDEKHRQ